MYMSDPFISQLGQNFQIPVRTQNYPYGASDIRFLFG